jgi:hypothetical protein
MARLRKILFGDGSGSAAAVASWFGAEKRLRFPTKDGRTRTSFSLRQERKKPLPTCELF